MPEWSNDDKYLSIKNENQEYLLDNSNKIITVIQNNIVKSMFYDYENWAPTKNISIFYTIPDITGSEKELYLFEADDEKLMKLNDGGISESSLYWSPDSNYVLMIDYADTLYVIDVNNLSGPPKKLFKTDGVIKGRSVNWSNDSQRVYFSYSVDSKNWLKPRDYYAASINISDGTIKTKYIKGLLYGEFKWVGENKIYYTISNEKGLYKTLIKW